MLGEIGTLWHFPSTPSPRQEMGELPPHSKPVAGGQRTPGLCPWSLGNAGDWCLSTCYRSVGERGLG